MVDGGRFFIVKLQKPAIYLESLTTVSTWPELPQMMSTSEILIPYVSGNRSTVF